MNDAWCNSRHSRSGTVSNQDRDDFVQTRPLRMVSTCSRKDCIAKAVSYVAGKTNESASYQEDES